MAEVHPMVEKMIVSYLLQRLGQLSVYNTQLVIARA